MTEHSISLNDGRRLQFAVYGITTARPILYFHGTPSSRLEPGLLNIYGVDLDGLLAYSNMQLIAVDRPGMGLSTFNPKGSFLSFANDCIELLNHLSIEKTSVLCWSGGGPYALAMGYAAPRRIESIHIICGFTQHFDKAVLKLMSLNKWYFLMAKKMPLILKTAMNILRKKEIRSALPQKFTGLPYVDYQYIKDASHLNVLARLTMKEACRDGAKGAVYEAASYFKDFGFHLSDIKQPIHYWWGTSDQTVVRLHAETVEKEARHCVLHHRQGEGHLSIYINCFKEVLQTISSCL